jgi:hypothetical protein
MLRKLELDFAAATEHALTAAGALVNDDKVLDVYGCWLQQRLAIDW